MASALHWQHVTWYWQAAVVITCGLAVLIGGTRLLRGDHAVLRVCGFTGAGVAAFGLAAGRVLAIAGGVLILGVVAWCAWDLRDTGQRRTGRKGRRS